MITALFFLYFFIAVALGSSLAILFCRNVFKAALWLLVCLLSIAAVFILSYAEFIGVAQILIYAGGIMVVMLFGIMFTSKLAQKPLRVSNTNLMGGGLAGILLFALLAKMIVRHSPKMPTRLIPLDNSIESIGTNLMTSYSLPFEVIGILLLVTLIGACVITGFMKLRRS